MEAQYEEIINELKNFFSDDYHYKLRLISQIKKNNFDESLEEYKKIFKFAIKNILDRVKSYLKDNPNCIEEAFFESIINIHLSEFENILNKYNLLEIDEGYNLKDVRGKLFFRARVSEDTLTPWDMFHIPFDKRYKIRNQRFSITGQPLLYLGGSVLNTVYEVGEKIISKLNFSSYYIPIENNFKIYDLTNKIRFYPVFINKVVQPEEKDSTLKYKNFNNHFFKFILTSICSFKNRYKDGHFSEEYVIPQILSSILSKKGFNGIIYYSTRIYFDIIQSNNLLDYKTNLVIFTNLNKEHVYDQKLYNSLRISNPIKITDIKEDFMDDNDIRNIYDNIKKVYLKLDNEQLQGYKVRQSILSRFNVLEKVFTELRKDEFIIDEALKIEKYLIKIELLNCI